MSDPIAVALRMLGVRCTVERRGTLAILTPEPGERALERADVRRDVLAVLRAHGYTHGAVEVPDGEPPTSDERDG